MDHLYGVHLLKIEALAEHEGQITQFPEIFSLLFLVRQGFCARVANSQGDQEVTTPQV